jgi:hypothetical protein
VGDAARKSKEEMDALSELLGIDPAANGYKLWHCLNACNTFRMCFPPVPPDEDPEQIADAFQMVLRLGGIIYEIGTACGGSDPPVGPWDAQPFRDWIIDTPGDLLANELGLYIGRYLPGVPCAVGCLAALKIPGPLDIGGNQP